MSRPAGRTRRGRREPPGHRRDEVLHRRRPLQAPQARDADAARPADPPEVVAQDVDDHRVLGAILAAASSSPASARSSARVRPRGRVPLIGSVRTRPAASSARNGSGDAERTARGRRSPARARGRRRRVNAPARRSAGAGRRTTARRRRAPRAAGSGWPGRARPRRSLPGPLSTRLMPGRPVELRAEDEAARRPVSPRAGLGPPPRPVCARPPAPARGRRASPSTARPPATPARPPVPGDAQSWSPRRRSGRPWSSDALDGSRSRRRPRS